MENQKKGEDELEWSLRTLAEKAFPPFTKENLHEQRPTVSQNKRQNIQNDDKPEGIEEKKRSILEEYEKELKKLFESENEELKEDDWKKLAKSLVKERPGTLEEEIRKSFLPSPEEVRRSMKVSYEDGLDVSPLATASEILSKDDFKILEALIHRYKTQKPAK